jgi:predicted O-methyltransferase YrrM
MTFQYPPIPNHPQVDLIDQKYWKMNRDEYMILLDVVKQTCGKVNSPEERRASQATRALEFGAGDGASTAVMLLGCAGELESIDIKPVEETNLAVVALEWELQENLVYTPHVMTTEEFRTKHATGIYDFCLVDGDHTHDAAAADINWAVKNSKVVVAHDIDQKDIARICERVARDSGKTLLSVNRGVGSMGIGHGLAIIY